MDTIVCVHCEAADDQRTLTKCPMCHRHACERCCHKRGGKIFCHVGCADEFFFGGDEDDT